MASRANHKVAYKCKGGPFDGGILWLTLQGSTLTFTAKGQTGRYVNDSSFSVKWEAT